MRVALAIRHHGGDQLDQMGDAQFERADPPGRRRGANASGTHQGIGQLVNLGHGAVEPKPFDVGADIVEEPLNIEVDDPVILLAALPGLCQCLMRGLVWPGTHRSPGGSVSPTSAPGPA